MSEVIAATCGVVLLVVVALSALRTTLVPRRSSSRMARWTVRWCAAGAIAVAGRLPRRPREWVMGYSMPAALLVMGTGWILGWAAGAALLAVGLGHVDLDAADLVRFFVLQSDGTAAVLGVVTSLAALLIIGLFVAYLVQIMGAYHRRERMIIRSASQVRVVTDADRLLADHLRTGSRDSLDSYFAQWADWLADIYDSHTSYPSLAYHRPAGRQCWAKAALIVMDTAALVDAVAPRWAPVHTKLLLDVGSMCLQEMAGRMGIVLPVTTISLHGREERAFSDTMRLATDSGLPAERDADRARSAFQEQRVRYAPYAVLISSRLLSPSPNGETV